MIGVDVNWKTIAAAVIAGGVVIWFGKKQVSDLAAAVNPVDPNNVINQGVQSAYSSVTDGQGSIGTDIWDLLHHEDGTSKWPWEDQKPLDLNSQYKELI